METVRELLTWARGELTSLGPEEARASAEFLMAALTGTGRSALYLRENQEPGGAVARRFISGIRRRKQRIPLAYILGEAGFWKERLEVGPACLIPRPETETLVEKFIENSGWSRQASFSFLDLGTGSGAIAIALLREFPLVKGWLSDVSPEALKIARSNIRRYGLESRAEITRSDLFAGFSKEAEGTWNAIIANPPYFADGDWEAVEPELRREPRMAFDGGPDGLEYYRRIVRESRSFLRADGLLVFELGKGQAPYVEGLLRNGSFRNIRCFKDDLSIDRVVMGTAA